MFLAYPSDAMLFSAPLGGFKKLYAEGLVRGAWYKKLNWKGRC